MFPGKWSEEGLTDVCLQVERSNKPIVGSLYYCKLQMLMSEGKTQLNLGEWSGKKERRD